MSRTIACCHHCAAPLGENDAMHLRGALVYCVPCTPMNDAPHGIWQALLQLVAHLLP